MTNLAHAQAPVDATESAEYRSAIDEAITDFKNQDWPAARVAFERAHALAPNARTLRGLGLSMFYLRDYAAARTAFEQALVETRKPLSPEQKSEIERFLASAKLETGRYDLRVSPSDATITVDDTPSHAGILVLARGSHTIRARADGFVTREAALAVTGNEDAMIDLSLVKAAANPAVPAPAAAAVVNTETAAPAAAIAATPRGPASEATTPRATLFTWVALTAVPVFGGAGAGIWFAGDSKFRSIDEACTRDHCSTAEADRRTSAAHLSTYSTLATVSLATAAVALVAAGVSLFVGGESSRAEAPKEAAMLSPTSSGAALTATF